MPILAKFFVNWAEICEGQAAIFHVTCIKSFCIDDKDGLRDSRRTFFRILQWGLTERKSEIVTKLAVIGQKLNGGITPNWDEMEEDGEEGQEGEEGGSKAFLSDVVSSEQIQY